MKLFFVVCLDSAPSLFRALRLSVLFIYLFSHSIFLSLLLILEFRIQHKTREYSRPPFHFRWRILDSRRAIFSCFLSCRITVWPRETIAPWSWINMSRYSKCTQNFFPISRMTKFWKLKPDENKCTSVQVYEDTSVWVIPCQIDQAKKINFLFK